MHKFKSEKIFELNLNKINIEKKKSNIGSLNQKCKNEIKNAFQIMRIRLNEKEKEIIEKTEITLKDNLNELNTLILLIALKNGLFIILIINSLHDNSRFEETIAYGSGCCSLLKDITPILSLFIMNTLVYPKK